jgi:tetratricopeptide (TPR) repeat protein
MLTDQYGLSLSTTSDAARDAYIAGCKAKLTMYPGAIEAFDRAIATDPGFALAHAAKAHALLERGHAAAARASMASANSLTAGLSDRETSHIAFFDLLVAGNAEAALSALSSHLEIWPRDALVLATTAFTNGLIGSSGRAGQKRALLDLLDRLAPNWGDDWWFTAHHGMALSENGQRDAARPKIERSLAQNPRNPWAAHAQAHLCYEEGDANAACAFLASWLPTYPRSGALYSHLSWHLALGHIEAGNVAAALRLFREAFAPDVHSGPPRGKVTDGVPFCGGGNWPGIPATTTPGGHCTRSRTRRFRTPARPFPTCISRSRKSWPATTRRWRRAHGRSTIWRERAAIHPAPSSRRYRAPSPLSKGEISPPRSKRSNRLPANSNASAAAAPSSTWWSSRCYRPMPARTARMMRAGCCGGAIGAPHAFPSPG